MEQQKPLNACERFCDGSSLPVVKYLLSRFSSKIRFFVLLVFLGLLSVTVYQCYSIIAYFLSDPIMVIVTETEKDNETFPALVICPGGQFRASQMVKEAKNWNRARDAQDIESDRHNSIERFRKENITLNQSFIDRTIKELRNISAAISIASEADLIEIKDRLVNLSKSLEAVFPIMASRLVLEEPIKDGRLLLNNISKEDSSGLFAEYRKWKYTYDELNNLFSEKNWSAALPNILQYGINGKGFSERVNVLEAIEDFKFMQYYASRIHFLRPQKEDIIVNCSWAGKECVKSDVWTPQGLCSRIGPKYLKDSLATHLGANADSTVNIIIDTLAHEVRDKPTKMYFYLQNETEFAQVSYGITVQPGQISHMSITQTRESIRSTKNCGAIDLKHFTTYTQEKCNWEKKTEKIETNCSCLSDLAPNYYINRMSEFKKTENDSNYNSSLNFCSFVNTIFCAPKALEENVDCPNTCTEIRYEVDMIANSLNEWTLEPKLNGTEERFSNVLNRMIQYGSFFKVPYSDHLDRLLDIFFRQHLEFIKLFWWRNDSAPYYVVQFDKYLDWQFNEYFACGADSGSPLDNCAFRTPISYFEPYLSEKLFFVPNETYSNFIDIISSTVEKYNKYHYGWKKNYTEEAFLPFIDDICSEIEEAEEKQNSLFYRMKFLILQKFMVKFKKEDFFSSVDSNVKQCRNMSGIELYYRVKPWLRPGEGYAFIPLDYPFNTNSSLSHKWTLRGIRDLNYTLEDYSENNRQATDAQNAIKKLIRGSNGNEFSVWEQAFSIYMNWFRDEIKEGGETIARAMYGDGYDLNVATVSRNYGIENGRRENLRKMLFDVSYALKAIEEEMKSIVMKLESMEYPESDADYLNFGAFLSILYRDSEFRPIISSMKKYARDTKWIVHDFISLKGVFQLPSGNPTRTLWYTDFTKLIDTRLYVYRDGADYHRANIAEMNIYFRSFRRRTIEEQRAYDIWKMLSDIGGALGLWLGATVLTFMELIILGLSPKFVMAKPKENASNVRNRRKRDDMVKSVQDSQQVDEVLLN